jgi:hypothetical protein
MRINKVHIYTKKFFIRVNKLSCQQTNFFIFFSLPQNGKEKTKRIKEKEVIKKLFGKKTESWL